MSPARVRPRRTRAAALLGLAATLIAAGLGCSRSDGVAEYLEKKKAEEGSAGALRNLGAKISIKQYPVVQREGYVVDLTGARLDDKVFEHLLAMQKVSELDLSKSSLTDADMGRVAALGGTLAYLNLSNTAVTDAGLDRLTDMKLLVEITLTGTKTTPAGSDRMRSRLLAARSPQAPAFLKQINVKR